MAQILVRNLPTPTIDRLKARAKRNRRSLEAEVREILELASVQDERRAEAVRFAAWAREQNGLQQTDSVELIREDRER